MSQRAEDLAAKYEQASKDFAAKVQALTDKQWQAKTPEEGWTVAATAHHAAGSSEGIMTLVFGAAGRSEMPPITVDMLNQGNAENAKKFASCSKEETLALLGDQSPKAATSIRGLTDAELAGKAMLPFGMEMSAEQVIENVLIGHMVGHSESVSHGAATA